MSKIVDALKTFLKFLLRLMGEAVDMCKRLLNLPTQDGDDRE